MKDPVNKLTELTGTTTKSIEDVVDETIKKLNLT
jgi:flavin-binding protein dodecin